MPSRNDLLVFVGVLSFVAGVAVIYWPAALILAGLLLVAVGTLGAKLEGRR